MDVKKITKKIGMNVLYSENIVAGFLVGIALGFLLDLTGAWYLMLVAGAACGFLAKQGTKSFIAGFGGVVVAWGIYFLDYTIASSFVTFTGLIGAATGLPGEVLVILALVIGGLLGGVGALVAAFATQLILGDRYKGR
ncbi:MAG TPA: hypothetical protein VKM55_28080 [Candidatus Lokiarchaeia archaeon]|nr:hypothetical protein [Candidatus Lokiarchaeia archaeon]